MADEEKDQTQGEQGTQVAPEAAKAPTPPAAETASEPETAKPLEQTVLDEAQVRAILSLPQIQQHIAASHRWHLPTVKASNGAHIATEKSHNCWATDRAAPKK